MKATQYTNTMKKIVQYILVSDQKEASFLADALENEAIPTIAPPPRPELPEDPNSFSLMIQSRQPFGRKRLKW